MIPPSTVLTSSSAPCTDGSDERGRQTYSRRALGIGVSALTLARLAGGEGVKGAEIITPIIFLPGILGSRLKVPGGPDWDPDDTGAMLAWSLLDPLTKRQILSLQIHPTLSPVDIFLPETVDDLASRKEAASLNAISAANGATTEAYYASRGWAGAAWSFYGPCLTMLEIELNGEDNAAAPPHPVYVFAYDWRQSCAVIADDLILFIDQVLGAHAGAKQVVLITHSMGGLVARAACLDDVTVAKIAGVIHAAQPSNGTITAYRRFHTGYVGPYDTGVVPGLQEQIIDNILSMIMGNSPEAYAMLVSGSPGPLEFLPNNTYHQYASEPWLVADPAPDLSHVYDLYRGPYPPGIIPPTLEGWVDDLGGDVSGTEVVADLHALIDSAESFHNRLADNGHPKTYVLYGTKLKSDTAVRFDPTLTVDQRLEGDGSVHQSSSSCPGLKEGYVREARAMPGVEHASSFASESFNQSVFEFVQKILSDS